ncbi:MAG: hypothetical protein K9M07_06545 [Simkaniaceae bacterium]|nr:hypothetical protein [Simkaniaceae bacterium]MCF7852882.1 hypothetical protein [Simkaniaceae bacterium]
MTIDWKSISLKELAGYLSSELAKDNIELILVGGACVTIYSHNQYQSYDLDFITYEDLKKVRKALFRLGFEERSGYFRHPKCTWIIEFVSPPVSIGQERIHSFFQMKTDYGTVKLLRPIDCIKDRLASFFHWNDRQGLDQAIKVFHEFQDIDMEEIKKWSIREGFLQKFEEFLQKSGLKKD